MIFIKLGVPLFITYKDEQQGETAICMYNCLKSMIWGSRSIINNLLRLDLTCRDSDSHVKYKVNRALTLGSTYVGLFLTKIKKVVEFSETRDFRLRTC